MNGSIALCSAVTIPATDGVPEWVHLLPAGQVRTVDGRGPYMVANMAALAAASLKGGQKLPIDENHATDKGAVLGLPAPARGWIVALEARSNGLWGKVQWTGPGRKLMQEKAYAGISPVIVHDKANTVALLLRASLTNTPNLQGLATLHSATGVAAAGAQTPLNEEDRFFMHVSRMSEGKYRAAMAENGLTVGGKPSPAPSEPPLSDEDRRFMHLHGMHEGEYRAAMAANGLSIGG